MSLYCAVCRERFEPDENHIWINAEHKRMNDRNAMDEYAAHPECWRQLTDDWMDPA